MPLHVTIKVNQETVETLHIGRIEGGVGTDDINTYLAVLGEEPLRLDDWQKRGTEYTHRYGDGALVCVKKALEAILSEKPENLDTEKPEGENDEF